MDTFLLKFEKRNFGKFKKKTGYVGEELRQGEKDYGVGGILYALFLAPNIEINLAITQHGFSAENNVFHRFEDATRLLDGKSIFI